jgi:hypothetical protein
MKSQKQQRIQSNNKRPWSESESASRCDFLFLFINESERNFFQRLLAPLSLRDFFFSHEVKNDSPERLAQCDEIAESKMRMTFSFDLKAFPDC